MSGTRHLLTRQISEQRGLLIAEYFGPTWQGEGPSRGRQALFIRLSRCNLACHWCDTPYSWDWTRFDPNAEATRLSVEELAKWALGHPTRLIELTRQLAEAGRGVEIETNGTIPPRPELVETVEAFNVSPKLSAAGMSVSSRIDRAALRAFVASGKARFKFVFTDAAQLPEADALVAAFQMREVWAMPEGTTAEAVISGMSALRDGVLARGWHLTGRDHILLWGNARGH
jgi:7-carboxy-7-deazaguanine synthase